MNPLLPHRRLNPLTNEWILVSPQRALRPWLGAVEKRAPEMRPAHDPGCLALDRQPTRFHMQQRNFHLQRRITQQP